MRGSVFYYRVILFCVLMLGRGTADGYCRVDRATRWDGVRPVFVRAQVELHLVDGVVRGKPDRRIIDTV